MIERRRQRHRGTLHRNATNIQSAVSAIGLAATATDGLGPVLWLAQAAL